MSENNVGAGILSIITESLYDNPIVVFREYVQNSIDSILKRSQNDDCEIKIWQSNDNLFFLDNGQGIPEDVFYSEMRKIGASSKKKHQNLGYKGIGRLSGVPYCEKLSFINIRDFTNDKAQLFSIDNSRYEALKSNDGYSTLSFSDLMDQIEERNESANLKNCVIDYNEAQQYLKIIEKTNTGFLVVLENISSVLKNTIENNGFLKDLQWLLPVDFDDNLYDSNQKELFKDLTTASDSNVVPVKCCRIYYGDEQILRPIQKEMLRDYVCKNNFKYATGFHSFKGDRILIDKSNPFSGIRIYIDNMLLCDENELLQNLDNYGLLSHTLNGQLQSVKGIGAMIYITDKVNISANARRTFIEVTDNDSLEFLKLLAEFVNTIYDTRYALSNYASAKVKQAVDAQKLNDLKETALVNLKKLAKENIEIPIDTAAENEFEMMSIAEKKRAIKSKISFNLDKKLKEYLKGLDIYDLQNAYENFFEWLQENI